MSASCNRANKWFRSCNWETIYDTQGPSEGLDSYISTSFTLPAWLAKLAKEETVYVGALCKTCGKYISRDGNE